jgi:hypothetical protein
MPPSEGCVERPLAPNGTSEVSVPRPTTASRMPYSSTRRSFVPPTWTTSQRAGVQACGIRPEVR